MKTELIKKFKPFRLSPITIQIEKYLRGLAENSIATYNDLLELTGLNCQASGKGYGFVMTARGRLAKAGHHFAVVSGVGLKKLGPNDAVKNINHKQRLNGKQVKRRTTELESVDFDRLGEHEKSEYQAGLFVGRIATRVLSKKVHLKVIADVSSDPAKKIDYEGLVDTYLRKKA